MKLEKFYKKVVEIGIKNDPRPKEFIEKLLEEKKKEYEKLEDKKKEFFDKDNFWNPFSDTRVFFEDLDIEIKTLMVGIDIEAQEVLAFDRLRKEYSLDLLIAHHPEGKALANFYEVMDLQVDILKTAGFSLSLAEDLLSERKKQVERKILPLNFLRTIDLAKIFKVPLMCIHTPADNCVYQFLKRYFEEKKPQRLKDIIELLLELPEYREAEKNNFGPRILKGNPNNRVERIFLEMTGGTEPHTQIYQELVKKGYDTIVSMHLSEEHFKKASDSKLNIIISGHISSDTLGLNLLFDEIEKEEPLEFVEVSGFRRFRHTK